VRIESGRCAVVRKGRPDISVLFRSKGRGRVFRHGRNGNPDDGPRGNVRWDHLLQYRDPDGGSRRDQEESAAQGSQFPSRKISHLKTGTFLK
jgi:hypothetical protein